MLKPMAGKLMYKSMGKYTPPMIVQIGHLSTQKLQKGVNTGVSKELSGPFQTRDTSVKP